MAICRNCGKDIEVVGVECPNCHTKVMASSITDKESVKHFKMDYDARSNSLLLLCVVVPIVGYVYYFLNRSERRLASSSALTGALIGTVIILFFLSVYLMIKLF